MRRTRRTRRRKRRSTSSWTDGGTGWGSRRSVERRDARWRLVAAGTRCAEEASASFFFSSPRRPTMDIVRWGRPTTAAQEKQASELSRLEVSAGFSAQGLRQSLHTGRSNHSHMLASGWEFFSSLRQNGGPFSVLFSTLLILRQPCVKKPVGSEKAWWQIVRKLRRGRRGGKHPFWFLCFAHNIHISHNIHIHVKEAEMLWLQQFCLELLTSYN